MRLRAHTRLARDHVQLRAVRFFETDNATVFEPAVAQLPAVCWCEAHTVLVPQREVRRGMTRSCGDDGCRGPRGHGVIGERCSDTGKPKRSEST